MIIIGLDPGVNTGIAIYTGGKLIDLRTVHPVALYDFLAGSNAVRVVFEDSRLQSYAWTARSKGNMGAALATARSLGQVDGICNLITEACARIGIDALGISPKGKGAKLKAEVFNARTGWEKASNQHGRDAAMVAWPYRGPRA